MLLDMAALPHRLRAALRSCPCLLAICLAGCASGVSGSSATSAAPPPPGSTFSARLDALCAQWSAQLSTTSTNDAQARLIERYMPRFRALSPPADQQPIYSLFISDLEREAIDLNREDAVGAQQVVAENKPLAAQLGTPACGK